MTTVVALSVAALATLAVLTVAAPFIVAGARLFVWLHGGASGRGDER